jgi:hypothetical protein
MPEFIPGLKLSELYYHEAVRPLLDQHFPGLAHSAALIGSGSDVIGFDTPRSTDHGWGPRLVLFITSQADQYEPWRKAIDEVLRYNLPYIFHGYSTNFDRESPETSIWMVEVDSGPVNHQVEITNLQEYFKNYLGFDPSQEIGVLDWLVCHEHRLLTATGGKVFHDDLGLQAIREKLAYYPHDVWLYIMAAAWMKISQEEPFMGRTGDVGDENGSRILAARLVQYLMRLGFLIERRYAPYSKWFGSGFMRLDCSRKLTPVFNQVLAAPDWQTRQQFLSQAYETLAEMHNALHVTPSLDTHVSSFHERPYLVIHGERFSEALLKEVQSAEVRELPPHIGSINQFVDSTDVADNVELNRRLKSLYINGA